MPFNQQMSFPREIKLFKDGNDYTAKCMPVKEIASLFTSSHFSVSKKSLSTGDNPTANYTGDSYVLDTAFDVNDSKGDGFGFLLDGFEVYYSIRNKKLTFNATSMDKKEVDLTPDNGKVSFRILADVGSLEVFANNGEVAAAFAYLPVIKTSKVTTIIKGEKVVMDNLSINEIGSIWNK
jgi:fructan beta-fructosidase